MIHLLIMYDVIQLNRFKYLHRRMAQNSSGMSSLSLAAVVFSALFVGLKLGKIIDWSWWWVLSPVWIPMALVIALLVLLGLLTTISK